MKGLPVDALYKIISYKIENPKYFIIEHNKTFKKKWHKHKILRFNPK